MSGRVTRFWDLYQPSSKVSAVFHSVQRSRVFDRPESNGGRKRGGAKSRGEHVSSESIVRIVRIQLRSVRQLTASIRIPYQHGHEYAAEHRRHDHQAVRDSNASQ